MEHTAFKNKSPLSGHVSNKHKLAGRHPEPYPRCFAVMSWKRNRVSSNGESIAEGYSVQREHSANNTYSPTCGTLKNDGQLPIGSRVGNGNV